MGVPPFRVVHDRKQEMLVAAQREGTQRGLERIAIVDCDCHHYELACLREIAPYADNPALRAALAEYSEAAFANFMLPNSIGDRRLAGRMGASYDFPPPGLDGHPVAAAVGYSMDRMFIDYSVLFPTPMLALGTHPMPDMEAGLALAYDRWLVDRVLSEDPRIKSMLYLPMSDPDACVEIIEELGDRPGVIGFMVTAVRYAPLYQNRYVPVYRALDERGLPLAFHSGVHYWGDRAFEQFNRFIGVHALGFPFYASVQLTNIVLNALPVRFPNIRWIFMEAGVAWIPFVMHRLDSEYRLRSSEAPLLERLPSEYILDFHFTTQPLEMPSRIGDLAAIFEMIDAERTLLYASDFPHQDWDMPSVIWDLPFIDERAKRRILGENALELFGLEAPARSQSA
jgi:predicted TIM-barrel fold metal-dependent hydrolase